ncbi:MAG: tyrosine--tRNA ligase [Candidatus Omnitrophica bacterium CG22_combo_CG10-13_8_21_14_all_43_16]|nr:MAG: tyrosine--tRNA ligase [Candidatus Omnitrophica bacterium CG22_combo_CG10-13_8_21_14_all_43_16]
MEIKKQLEIIKRGTVEIISEKELIVKLEKNRPLVVKAGFDPSAPDIHLGHTVILRKLKHFQDLGHKVVFLIGDFTGMIGDPTGKSEIRKRLTEDEIKENAKTYKKQVFKILDEKTTEVVFNSAWLAGMTLKDTLELVAHVTVSQVLARADFSERYKSGKDISFLEFMYPLLQAYDSVELKADVELGGTDQKFNLLMGRELQKDFGQESQVVIMTPLLVGLDGVNKMSKSLGNHIGIDEKPEEMFGKIMSISDELMFQYYELLTDEGLDEIRKLHPMEAKKKLAKDIVKQYHGENPAEAALKDFENKFQKRDPFTELKLETKPFKPSLADFLVGEKILPSKAEYKRLIEQDAIEVNGARIKEIDFKLEPSKEYCIKVGKKRFLKVLFKA